MATSPTDPIPDPYEPYPQELLAGVRDMFGREQIVRRQWQNWAAGTPFGGENHDGTYPFTDADGSKIYVKSPKRLESEYGKGARGPEYYGAVGDGQSHQARYVFNTLADCQAVYPFAVSLAQEMDFLAWQAMVNDRGSFVCPHTTYKMCNPDPDSQHPLDWTAGRSEVDASFSILDWGDMRAKTTNEHVFDNYDVHSPDGWLNSTIYPPGQITYVTFDKGYAEGIDTFDDDAHPGSPYYAFGYRINPAPGRYRVTVEGVIKRGVSYHHGNLGTAYGFVNFSSQYGIDQGGWEATGRYIQLTMNFDDKDPENVWTPFSGQFDIEVNPGAPPGHIMFKGGGYMDLRLTRLDIMPFVPNCAILNNRDHSDTHYFIAKRFRNAWLMGPFKGGSDWVGLTCGYWKSFASIDGDLQDWERVRAEGWEYAVQLSDGAYLLQFFECMLLGEGSSIYFPTGSANAGENIRLYGGGMSAGRHCIDNPGSGEFTLFGSFTDYMGRGLCSNNAGIIRCIGLRHEQHIPDGHPIWHCTTGYVTYSDCFLLLAGPVDFAPMPLAELDTSGASLEFINSRIYNLSTASGVVANGAGAIHTRGLMNSGNPNIGADLLTTNDSMDVLGGAGKFEPVTGETGFINQDPSGIYLQGGLFTLGGKMIDRWNSENIKVAPSNEYARSGTRSLKVSKTSGRDENSGAQLQFLVPIHQQGNLTGRMFFLFPNALDRSLYPVEEFPFGPLIFFRQFWMQVTGYDALGRPIYSNRGPFKGEGTIRVPLDGDPQWIKRRVSTLYEPASLSPDRIVKAPAWVTHYMIAIDFQSVAQIEFYIDDFQMNFLA